MGLEPTPIRQSAALPAINRQEETKRPEETKHNKMPLLPVDIACAEIAPPIITDSDSSEAIRNYKDSIKGAKIFNMDQMAIEMGGREVDAFIEEFVIESEEEFFSLEEEEEFFSAEEDFSIDEDITYHSISEDLSLSYHDENVSMIHGDTFPEILEGIRDKRALLEEQGDLTKYKVIDQKEVSFFENLTRQLEKIADREGTTLVTALTTLAAGTVAGVALGGFVGAVIGTGGLLVVGNEAIKMVCNHLKVEGASDHLQVIENAIENMKAKNGKAQESIDKAVKLKNQMGRKLMIIDNQILKIQNNLEKTSGNLTKVVEKTVAQLEEIKKSLSKQDKYLEETIELSKKVSTTLDQQKLMLEELMAKPYEIKKDEDVVGLVKTITQEIKNIHALSTEAYENQMRATGKLMKAFKMNSEISDMSEQTGELINKIHEMENQLEDSTRLASQMQEKIEEGTSINQNLESELEKQNKIIEQQKIELGIVQQHIQMENTKYFLGDSPQGMIGAGIIALIGLRPFAIRSISYARKMMRAYQTGKKETIRQKFDQVLNKMKVIKRAQEVTVKAKFGYSQGNIIGSWTPKFLYNLISNKINHLSNRKLLSEWRSSVAGSIKCKIGNLTLPLSFNKKEGSGEYGAISVADQQHLTRSFLKALETKKMTPETVLNFLSSLEDVEVGKKRMTMINRDSPAVKELKEKALSMKNALPNS